MAFLVINRSRLDENIARVQAIATRHRLDLRPHVKTHKCLEIARLQLAAGATGLTASRPAEAAVFLREGLGPLTIAYPIVDPSSLDAAIAEARERDIALRVIVDSIEGFRAVASASSAYLLEVMVKIDVGLHRCGVLPGDPSAPELARMIQAHPTLAFSGILSHAGHAYGAATTDEIIRIAEGERTQMLEARERIERSGVPVRNVSVGSTPTVLGSMKFDGITEIRPGNYVFLDRTQVSLGVATLEQIALNVRATVISRNEHFFIIDAGSKTLSSDRGAHGEAGIDGLGLVFADRSTVEPLVIERLSEEHGFVRRGGIDLAIGSQVSVLPNHACVVANLAHRYHVDAESWDVRHAVD